MRECGFCGKAIPRRKTKGHREREYCCDNCRKAAWLARNKDKHNLERIQQQASERYWTSLHQEIHRETWQDELENKDELLKLLLEQLEQQRNVDDYREAYTAILQAEIERLKDQLAEKEAEIVRLTALLQAQAKRKRPDSLMHCFFKQLASEIGR